jgi:hypothetical protein
MELEGSGVRASVVRPGPTLSDFGRGWDAGLLRRLLGAWKYWGVQRHLVTLPAESVAEAIVSVALAPPGTHVRHVEVMPEGPRGARGEA